MNHRNADLNVNDPSGPLPPTQHAVEIHPAVIKWALIIGLIVAIVVTASSFNLSFQTLHDLATMANMGDSAWVIPVVLDGPILAAGIFRIALSQHSDRATKLGRLFIVAVYILAGLGSMAANAYHAVLTVTDLNAGVAAALGALAPLMVMTMSEMISVVISAPRRRIGTTTQPVSATAVESGSDETVEQTAADDGADDLIALLDQLGTLEPEIWQTANLYQNDPETKGNFAAVSRRLGVTPPTVARRYDRYSALVNKVTAMKAAEYLHSPAELETEGEDRDRNYALTTAAPEYTNAS
ncbi:MAG: DUF2637 domain-containing protein [Rhodococcus sp.]|nr:DUF2637 domain-containing protein [Rhodococcus sp. (in: high G+C Gram-positive bacteria)]MBJ7321733.1 DUF2637 domain-containing protein [Rhodococcus sp. (in: high G+C Gram-positive bacteria)]